MKGSEIGEAALHTVGGVANPLVHALYPFEQMYRFHATHHIAGLTGRWMDTGAFALGGNVAGPWHRLAHGHHLLGDGVQVAFHPKLKFGEFLHHLGMDSLTKTGVPNPLFPASMAEGLMKLGFSKAFTQEFLTLNVPKVLGGSLGLVLAGNDVVACISDQIPHTFGAAGRHFLFGCLNLAFGAFPPNFLLYGAAAAEFTVAGVTAYRACTEPVVEFAEAPAQVFFPAIGAAIAVGAVGGLVAAILRKKPGLIPRLAFIGGSAAAASKFVGAAAAASAAPLMIGPLAGISVGMLLRSLLGDPQTTQYMASSIGEQNEALFPAWSTESRVGHFDPDAEILELDFERIGRIAGIA